MCVLCKDNYARTYTHCLNSLHKLKLFAIFKQYKKDGFIKYR